MKLKLTLSQRILAAVVAPLVAIFAILGGLISVQLNDSVPALIEDGSRAQVEARGDEVSRWLGGYQRWLAFPSFSNPRISGVSARIAASLS